MQLSMIGRPGAPSHPDGRMSTYALVSPVRSEAGNLRRIAEVVAGQTITPMRWVIVDNGSSDSTPAVVAELARWYDWVTAVSVPGAERALPGSPVVRAFHAGLEVLDRPWPDVVVKLDVDTTFAADHFQRILEALTADPRLGITGGVCLEEQDGAWRPTHVTADHVRGAVRAYRRECLLEVLPLEDGMGWDGIDELKAQSRGWSTRVLTDISFRHHRPVGARDGSGRRRLAEGRGAHYMGYRPSYLIARCLYQSRRDPRALGILMGYLDSALRRRPTLDDRAAVSHLREKQRLRSLRARAREARGRR
jgi:poly-beta-1,6-N-acetyl-D-glucosamine synthase